MPPHPHTSWIGTISKTVSKKNLIPQESITKFQTKIVTRFNRVISKKEHNASPRLH